LILKNGLRPWNLKLISCTPTRYRPGWSIWRDETH
jgi:hypothetical protein